MFRPHPRLGNRQISCGRKRCKRRQKRLSDKHYKQENTKIYLKNRQDWLNNNPGYWKKYRVQHPEYVVRNREQTKLRKSLSTASRSGLQKRIDILQPLESYMKFWHFHQFAKANRSPVALILAYNYSRIEKSTTSQRRSP